MDSLQLIALPGDFSICRLTHDADLPKWASTAPADSFISVTRTADELSIVCHSEIIPADVECESSWRCFRVAGELDFSLVGVMFSLTKVLATVDVSVFVISTFNTDYLLVRKSNWSKAATALREAGFEFVSLA